MPPQKNSKGELVFKDFPEFLPNLTPREMFKLGSFGGTYWRPIYSSITKRRYVTDWKKHPASWWKGIPDDKMISSTYDSHKNKYGVKVGTSLKFWENKKWITRTDPRGWVQWYCNFYSGRRTADDNRQITRWIRTAGPNSRFRKWLITQILHKKGKYNDFTISPKIRQTLQHWAYKLNKRDFDEDIKKRKEKNI